MRLILSRKGFDSGSGGGPSPILPDGRPVSLPIPQARSGTSWQDVGLTSGPSGIASIGDLMDQLFPKGHRPSGQCHLDPDLDPLARPRPAGWRPLFGQTGAAQSHLDRQGVGPGDLFLFFGWFRQTRWGADGRLQWVPKSDHHRIFGWLQIDETFDVDDTTRAQLPWAAQHPHVLSRAAYQVGRNVLHVARHQLSLPDLSQSGRPGGGFLSTARDSSRLTREDAPRSVWSLPEGFRRPGEAPPLSCHAVAERWEKCDEGWTLRSAPRGQEFVLPDFPNRGLGTWVAEVLGLA